MIERSIKITGGTVRVILPYELVIGLDWYDGCRVQWRLGDNFLLLNLTESSMNSRVTNVTRTSHRSETLIVTIPIDFARDFKFVDGDRVGFSLHDGGLKMEKVLRSV